MVVVCGRICRRHTEQLLGLTAGKDPSMIVHYADSTEVKDPGGQQTKKQLRFSAAQSVQHALAARCATYRLIKHERRGGVRHSGIRAMPTE
eukprot:31892-Eustigmatos_ZCMA.PRE.1